MGVTALGLEAFKSGLGFLSGLGTNAANARFNAQEAQKDRDFQERMYNQQVKDNMNFWRLQADYANPSAELSRIQDAGLNPLLMYGSSGMQSTVAAPQAATAPHGSTARTSFQNPFEAAQLGLLNAQADVMKSQAEKNRNESNESRHRSISLYLQNQITEATQEAVIAMKNKENDKLDREIDFLATQDFALNNMTAASINNLASMIAYREKYYNLDAQRLANDFWYQVQSIAIGKAHVSNDLKKIAVDWYRAGTERMEVKEKVKVFAAQVKEINSKSDLNEQEKTNKILDAYNQVLRNAMLENVGTEQLSGLGGLLLLMSGNISGRIQ